MNSIRKPLLLMSAFICTVNGQDRDERINELERKLSEARSTVAALQRAIDGLTTEIQALRQPAQPAATPFASISRRPDSAENPENANDVFRQSILRPDLGGDERGAELTGRPELFVQSRFQALPISGTDPGTAPSNFVLTRMETRWSGRVADKIGMGFEIQYHPAPAGAAVELVNDAFLEYYPNSAITIRGGQFVKPFGFDIQQSSGVRESPERGIFAGYFFPGQRDRGVMVTAKLDSLGSFLHGTQIFAAALNGNRFFIDSNRQVNYNVRLRKVFDRIPLAIGASVQLGRQLLPEGVSGNNRENLYGADVQWAWKRLGVRAEFVAGNMPSTLLSLDPEFAPQFRPGAHAAGGAIFSSFRVVGRDRVYARYDQFNRDLISGKNIRAFNFGYLRYLGEHARVGVDYQFKNGVSLNDDFLNTKLQVVWNVTY
jgi:hypothetical protein